MISSDEIFLSQKDNIKRNLGRMSFTVNFVICKKRWQILGVFDCKQIFQVVEELEENHDMAGVLGKTIGVGCGEKKQRWRCWRSGWGSHFWWHFFEDLRSCIDYFPKNRDLTLLFREAKQLKWTHLMTKVRTEIFAWEFAVSKYDILLWASTLSIH